MKNYLKGLQKLGISALYCAIGRITIDLNYFAEKKIFIGICSYTENLLSYVPYHSFADELFCICTINDLVCGYLSKQFLFLVMYSEHATPSEPTQLQLEVFTLRPNQPRLLRCFRLLQVVFL